MRAGGLVEHPDAAATDGFAAGVKLATAQRVDAGRVRGEAKHQLAAGDGVSAGGLVERAGANHANLFARCLQISAGTVERIGSPGAELLSQNHGSCEERAAGV